MPPATTMKGNGMTDDAARVLTDRVQGPVFLPDSDGYGGELAGFQTAFQNRPDVVVGASGAGDVRAAVEHATRHSLPVAVEATGHGRASTVDGGVLVSTRRMSAVRVDPAARTAWVEAGVRWEQVIAEAARHGLAPLNGSAPHVGAVAYTLGGGQSILAREYGFAADHVRSVDVVTADGRLRHVTADSDPDLFWALRGAGANFGVVTSMEVDLVPVSRIYGGGMYFGAELVPDVLRTFGSWSAALPEQLTSSVSLLAYPDVPALPEPLRGRYVAHVRVAYTGDAAEGERLVAPLRAIGHRLIDGVGEMPYSDCGSIYSDPPMPHAYHGGNVLLSELDGDALRAVAELTGPDAPVMCVLDLRHMGGALSREPDVPNAVGHRDARYILRVLSMVDGAGVGPVREVHDQVYETLAPWTIGRSLNFLYGQPGDTELVRASYRPDDYRRLTRLKAGYDPANTFRLNYNIPPAAG